MGFSDIVNVLLFGGEDTVKESELSSAGVVSQYKVGKTVHGQERDVAKLWTRKEESPYGNIRIAWLSDETVQKFKSDFRIVADYFVQVRKNKDYIPSREQMRHVNEVLNLMTALTDDNRFEEVKNFRKAEVL